MESLNDKEDINNVYMKHSKQGGWTTMPFIFGSIFALTMTAFGWLGNIVVYLITNFNVNNIDATQINNVVLGCYSLFPIAGAIISDSFFGSFPVCAFFSAVSLLGVILMALTSSLHSLRPPSCTNMSIPCESPSKLQYGVLYTILGLACVGIGGTRFTIATMGADQFENSNDTRIYFNWYFCFFYGAISISSTAIFFIQDNISWTLGFGISVACNAIGLILLLSGKKFYKHIKPKGSPFASIARVIIAAVRKRRVSSRNHEYNYDINDESTKIPSNTLRFLNRGALKVESDDSQNSRSWSLCSVQEVQDLKTLIRILPLWSSSLMLSVLVSTLINFPILQALTMDRNLGVSHFKIPAASFLFFNTLASSISLFIIDRFIFPAWRNLIGQSPTPLQRIGVGHVLTVVAMVSSALIEAQRLHVARAHHLTRSTNTVVPFSALWLVVPLAVMGISEAFHLPGQISLYYEEFPTSLRSTSSAMISLFIAIGFYLSTAITSLIRRSSGWLKDDLNDGRLDIVYWMLAGVGIVNFGYFLVCAKMFKHKSDTVINK